MTSAIKTNPKSHGFYYPWFYFLFFIINFLPAITYANEFLYGNFKGKTFKVEKGKKAFTNKNLQFLVSTDVSARGIDVKDLEFVIHHQLPEQLEYYTHRSGRTARAGKNGTSLAFILPNEIEKIHQIQSKLNINFTEINV